MDLDTLKLQDSEMIMEFYAEKKFKEEKNIN